MRVLCRADIKRRYLLTIIVKLQVWMSRDDSGQKANGRLIRLPIRHLGDWLVGSAVEVLSVIKSKID